MILIFLLDHKDIVHVVCLEQGTARGSGNVLICPHIQLLRGILGLKKQQHAKNNVKLSYILFGTMFLKFKVNLSMCMP